MVTPIWADGELRAFAANRAHHGDVGGAVAGSFYAHAYENYQEGLRIPPVKLYRAGAIDRDVFELILRRFACPRSCVAISRRNSPPTALPGALCRDMREVRQRYRRPRDHRGCAQSERRMRAVITGWPDGVYVGEDWLDNDGHRNEPVLIRVAVRVEGDRLVVDFSGTDPQVRGPLNAVFGMTASSVYLALQAATDPHIPSNDGCYRPIGIEAPSGSVVNATFPAACTGGNETSHLDPQRHHARAERDAVRPPGHGRRSRVL